MARLGANINAAQLQSLIDKVENTSSFNNRSALWKAVESLPEALACKPVPLTASRAYVLSKEFRSTIKTPLGKKGKQKGSSPPPNAGRKGKVISLKVLTAIKNTVPTKFIAKYDKFKKGGMKAAIALKCHDCTCYQPKEIKNCEIISCSLFPFRPYQ